MFKQNHGGIFMGCKSLVSNLLIFQSLPGTFISQWKSNYKISFDTYNNSFQETSATMVACLIPDQQLGCSDPGRVFLRAIQVF